ncbi:hypothetical protein CGRA01v4_10257 [Colletotrichum graminicola]|nr:hypothetical protein CGRA01v4_10257 [Colletotrichum graminicola]
MPVRLRNLVGYLASAPVQRGLDSGSPKATITHTNTNINTTSDGEQGPRLGVRLGSTTPCHWTTSDASFSHAAQTCRDLSVHTLQELPTQERPALGCFPSSTPSAHCQIACFSSWNSA